MSNIKDKPLLWHYTVGSVAKAIFDSGELRTAEFGVASTEKPILWFSANQYWEETANKAIEENGKTRSLNMKETYKFGGGLLRFGLIKNSRLHQWPKLAKKANMQKEISGALEKVAYDEGANPRDWYGSTTNISLAEIEYIEVMNEHMEWERVT